MDAVSPVIRILPAQCRTSFLMRLIFRVKHTRCHLPRTFFNPVGCTVGTPVLPPPSRLVPRPFTRVGSSLWILGDKHSDVDHAAVGMRHFAGDPLMATSTSTRPWRGVRKRRNPRDRTALLQQRTNRRACRRLHGCAGLGPDPHHDGAPCWCSIVLLDAGE